MCRIVLALLLIALVAPAADVSARTSSSKSTSPRKSASKAPIAKTTVQKAPHSTTRCASCDRDSRGRIERSSTPKHAFQKSQTCPVTGKTSGAGHVIDHRYAAEAQSRNSPDNMQWQTAAANTRWLSK